MCYKNLGDSRLGTHINILNESLNLLYELVSNQVEILVGPTFGVSSNNCIGSILI